MNTSRKGDRQPNAGEHWTGGETVAANHSAILYHAVYNGRTSAAHPAKDSDALGTTGLDRQVH
jgi:hypothetical protein